MIGKIVKLLIISLLLIKCSSLRNICLNNGLDKTLDNYKPLYVDENGSCMLDPNVKYEFLSKTSNLLSKEDPHEKGFLPHLNKYFTEFCRKYYRITIIPKGNQCLDSSIVFQFNLAVAIVTNVSRKSSSVKNFYHKFDNASKYIEEMFNWTIFMVCSAAHSKYKSNDVYFIQDEKDKIFNENLFFIENNDYEKEPYNNFVYSYNERIKKIVFLLKKRLYLIEKFKKEIDYYESQYKKIDDVAFKVINHIFGYDRRNEKSIQRFIREKRTEIVNSLVCDLTSLGVSEAPHCLITKILMEHMEMDDIFTIAYVIMALSDYNEDQSNNFSMTIKNDVLFTCLNLNNFNKKLKPVFENDDKDFMIGLREIRSSRKISLIIKSFLLDILSYFY
ncbi:hypothetical protein HERIO_1656 [Hepatospora eriocheir]|uniref:Uncharacterized protein n=1 Tax=Hepatospora eriocheir TaxID=1081669 RepID=A0A1X0Q9F3_9MICR|nr:hypothetical protein HERIO_1656 [Hepatospora eriocheir]